MPEIIPIRDLKNTNAISQRCHETQEPIFVTKSGYGDMVIMSIKASRMLSGEFLFISSRVFFLAHWLIISTIIITAEFKLKQNGCPLYIQRSIHDGFLIIRFLPVSRKPGTYQYGTAALLLLVCSFYKKL